MAVSAHRPDRGIVKILAEFADFLARRDDARRYANGGDVDGGPLELQAPDVASRFSVGDMRLSQPSLGQPRSPGDDLRIGGAPRSPADHLSLGVPHLDPEHNANLRGFARTLAGAGGVLDRAGAMGAAAFAGAPRGAEYAPGVLGASSFGLARGGMARPTRLAVALATRRRGARR